MRQVEAQALQGTAGALSMMVDRDGSAAHPAFRRLARSDVPLRDLADAIHLICILHGQMPGIADLAVEHGHIPEGGWIETLLDGFAHERALLVRMAALAGPMPSTPGQAETEATVVAQRHAIAMLGRSDRVGCAIGATAALAIDWLAIRALADRVGQRLGHAEQLGDRLPAIDETFAAIEEIAITPAIERAVLFGAQQLLLQHHGLWSLIDARAEARGRA